MKYISFFKDINKSDVTSVGGKAASLGEMTAAGIPVPNGFAINVDAYRDFAGKTLSADFKKELLEAFDKLGAQRVAIRSSAVGEDGSDASWAGQLESYLNVTRDKLEPNIQKCWKSIRTERAAVYAKSKGLGKDSLAVGVVVQAMVDSVKSGVMFTVDPISKDKNKMVIESLYGLGEMIVQGIVTPDNYVLTKAPLSVEEFNIAIKDKQMIYQDRANKVVKVADELADKATLDEDEVLELAKMGLAIEKHYHTPQDIEWASDGSHFYIVQSRPITTL